jgi:exosortase/archaeosortase family protein
MTRARKLPVDSVLVIGMATFLLVLPFETTFNDLLTQWALVVGGIEPLRTIAPIEAGMAVAVLNLVGIHAGMAGDEIVVWDFKAQPVTLFLSWNCVGWQGLVLLALTFLTGLRGDHPLTSKIQVVCAGLLGTLLVNVVRVTLVCLLAAVAGKVPAILFHDYAGRLMVLAWLFVFWFLAQRWLLPQTVAEEVAA